jgi:hypothetical protein
MYCLRWAHVGGFANLCSHWSPKDCGSLIGSRFCRSQGQCFPLKFQQDSIYPRAYRKVAAANAFKGSFKSVAPLVKLLAASKTSSRTKPQSVKREKTETLSLSAYEIFALQAIFEGCTGPLIEDIIANNLDITNARAHQSLESIRRKGLVTCNLGKDGEIEYSQTEQGLAWLALNTRGSTRQ